MRENGIKQKDKQSGQQKVSREAIAEASEREDALKGEEPAETS